MQDYKNHIRWYIPHHFVFYPVITAAMAISACYAWHEPVKRPEWLAITAIFAMMAWLSYMLRQHYALMNQNRIVRLELRLRYYVLTQQRLEAIEGRLSFSQLAALRFAGDEELPELVNRVLSENLTAVQIKKAIRNWQPDHMRV